MQTTNRKPTRELSTGEIITWTFNLYSEKFPQYAIPFLIASAITGLLITALMYVIIIPPYPSNPTAQQTFAWLGTAWQPALQLLLVDFMIWWIVIANVAQGISAKFTQELLETGAPSLRKSYNFAMSELPKLIVDGIITGICIFAGTFAFIIPGIIIAIIFSLVVQAIIIENNGMAKSFSRSRLLISYRWLKTFSVLLLLYAIIGTFAVLVGIVSVPFGEAALLVDSILTAFILPILPIGLTLHYYSIIARTMPQEPPLNTQDK